MKLIQLTTLLIVLFTLHGCGFRDEGDVEIKKAVLYGPDEEFEFKRIKKYPTSLIASDGIHNINISLFPINGHASLRFHVENAIIKFNASYYELNNTKKERLIIKRAKNSHKKFNIISPLSMDDYASNGDGLYIITQRREDITRKHKNKINKQTYRYYIPFSIDDRDYAIDITFKLKIKTSLEFGVPGGMP